MDLNKRQDAELILIQSLLRDVQSSHGVVFGTRQLRLTCKKVVARYGAEGISFLTKTLPRLGKALDKALSEESPLSAAKLGFEALPNSQLPRFLGELFSCVLSPTGTVLQDPCAASIKTLRLVLYCFYKYELPFSHEQEQSVVDKFVRTEADILSNRPMLEALALATDERNASRPVRLKPGISMIDITREARRRVSNLFAGFDFTDIIPRHGPGAVATKQQLWTKFEWTNVCSRIRAHFPLDAYFYASMGAVCDDISNLNQLADKDLPARVLLVPKDSRGPRLISCEPVDFQWVQQGISRSLTKHIEGKSLVKGQVRSSEGYTPAQGQIHFTDQTPNRIAAQYGSRDGRYATLDLNEASDRVSLDLVRLLFPKHVSNVLEAVRSSSTVLPGGQILSLNKFAPMGSALCFPILAVTVWAILTAGAPDAYTQERILVYGDDVVVPAAHAVNAIEQLESFGLKVNRDKSCTKGFFRESCGMDAFKGVDVTPVRFRTTWSSSPSADVYSSWIAYANSMFDRRCFHVYDTIVEMLHSVYGAIPAEDMRLSCPSLREVPADMRPKRRRTNKSLQKVQYLVRDVKSPSISHESPGWSMLLRFFTEVSETPVRNDSGSRPEDWSWLNTSDNLPVCGATSAPFAVRQYTRRKTGKLVLRWR